MRSPSALSGSPAQAGLPSALTSCRILTLTDHSVGDHCTAASSESSTAGCERIMSSSKKVNFSPSMSTNRSEEHTSELQSLQRISSDAFCLNKTHPSLEQKTKYTYIYNTRH